MAKILLVEDDPMISEIYQRKFESAGFEIAIAETGKEVLNKVKKEHFDLILLDLVLPEMSGMDVLKEIKQSGKYDPLVKIIIFSNLNEKSEQDKAFSLGADGFIPKSQFNPSQLVEEIKRFLREKEEAEKNEIRRQNGYNHEILGENNSKKILFVEDEDIFIEIFGKKLQYEGYNVTFVKDGNMALKELKNNDYDLIITDMVAGKTSGIDLIKFLKKEEKTKDIPIIVLSASYSDEELRQTRELGVTEYFVKTRTTPSDLYREVREIISD